MHPTDPDDDEPPADILSEPNAGTQEETDPPISSYGQRPEIDVELKGWKELQVTARGAALREVIAGTRVATPEVLVRLCCLAREQENRAALSLAFEAFTKTVTPLLLSQAWGMSPTDRQDQVQEILLRTFAAIQNGKADFAANWFAAFAKRQAISLYRMHHARFEGANQRNEPVGDNDPLDEVHARIPSAEARVMLGVALRKLSVKQRAVVIQRHLFEMTQKEIAAHHDVSVRTVHSWLKEAARTAGLTGDTHDE
jgi:RNA polymerase sigma factor (sigma-70 family)